MHEKYNNKYTMALAETFASQPEAHSVIDDLAHLFQGENSMAHPNLIGKLQAAAYEKLDPEMRRNAAAHVVQLNTAGSMVPDKMSMFTKDLMAAQRIDDLQVVGRYTGFTFHNLLSVLYGLRSSGASIEQLTAISTEIESLELQSGPGTTDESKDNDRLMKAAVALALKSDLPTAT